MRRLNGAWDHAEVVRVIIFAVKREVFALPCPENEIERLFEAFAALFLRDVEPDVIEWERAPSDPEFETPIAQDIGDRRLLGDLHRVVQGQ